MCDSSTLLKMKMLNQASVHAILPVILALRNYFNTQNNQICQLGNGDAIQK